MPAPGPERLQLGGQGLVGVELRRQGIELQGRIAIQPRQHADQVVEAQAPLLQAAQEFRRQGQQLALPVVMHDFQPQLAVVALQLHGRPQPRLEGLALQAAAAEAMDRGDVGPIEILEGFEQAGAQGPLGLGVGVLALVPLGQGGVWIGQGVAGGFEGFEALLQAPGDAIAQFARGGLGEGHHQQLLEPLLAFGHQAQHQMGQGKGLARAGAGLQQLQARIKRKPVGVEIFDRPPVRQGVLAS